MAKKYNPYNDYRKIVGYKGNWHTAQEQGQSPDQYYQAAMPYYQSLIDNGYQALADDLTASDYIKAKGLKDKYGLKEDNEFYLDDDYNSLTGQAAEIVNAPHPNDSYINKYMDLGTGTGGMAAQAFSDAQGIANGTTPITPSIATQGILDAYADSNDRLNGAIRYDAQGNVISGLNTEHYNIGRNQLDYINNFDVTKQPYYQGIMDQYKLGGYNAAQGEYANGAANNGGNIDSYAAANANRQQLAFTTAGQQAALQAAQQNANNWQTLYSQMSNDLYNQGQMSMQTLGIARDMYATDAQERMNALDTEGALASEQMANAIKAFEQMVQERMADKGISADMAMQEADIAAQKDRLETQLASDERMQAGINDTNRYTSDNQLRGTMYTSDNDLAGTMYTSDNNLRGNMYTSDNNLRGTMYTSDNQLRGTLDTNATNLTRAQLEDAFNRYAENHNYQLGKAQLQNSIDQILAQGEQDRQNAQFYAKNGYDSSGKKISSNDGGDDNTPDDPYGDAMTFITSLLFEMNPDDLKRYKLDTVRDVNSLKQWFMDIGGLDYSDAEKAAKAVLDKNTGYPEAIEAIQNALNWKQNTANDITRKAASGIPWFN